MSGHAPPQATPATPQHTAEPVSTPETESAAPTPGLPAHLGAVQRAQLLRLNRSVGNAAVSRVIAQRQAAEQSAVTPEQKAAALAKAAAAEDLASGTSATGATQASTSVSAAQGERAVAQSARQQTRTASGAAKNAAQTGARAKPAALARPQRRDGPIATPPASAPATGTSPAHAGQDAAFQAVVAKTRRAGAQQRRHTPAAQKATQAQAAAVSPAAELAGQAQDAAVGKVAAAPTPEFNAAAFKARLMVRIMALAPKNTEEADNFKSSGKLAGVKGDMQGGIAQEQQRAAGPTAQQTAAAPNPGDAQPKATMPLLPEQAGPPPALNAQGAAPKPRTAQEVEAPIRQAPQQIDQQLGAAGVSEQQLAESNEPAFQGALDARSAAKQSAAETPTAFRQQEQAQLAGVQADASSTTQGSLAGMHAGRAGILAQVAGQQTQTRTRDEQERARVGGEIQAIYAETKTAVEAKLGGLDASVDAAFDRGSAAAKTTFENYIAARMDAYKERRYGGWFGWARWAKDKIAGMPAAVNAFYSEGRALYLREMDAVVGNVAQIVSKTLSEAKAEVARGRQRIKEYLAGLPTSLRQIGDEAAAGVDDQLNGLEDAIRNKEQETVDRLAQKYNENLQAIDARIEECKAANKGLVDKALDAVVGVIKTILALKDILLNVLARAADVIGTIIKHPIQFLGNLISGVTQGLQLFVSNIGEHLRKGLMTWLFGEVAKTGIEMPKSLDIKGILTLAMQLLGMTWDFIRARAVRLFGDPAVKLLEGSFDVFRIIKDQGLGGLWEFIKDQLGDLKETVLGSIKQMVTSEVVQAGIQWLLSMLGGPAGAFIKAVKAIIDIVTWFVNNGSRVAALVNSVLDSVGAIASGAVGTAARFIEDSLGKAVPVMLGFLSSLLGLGGFADKIKGIIQKIQQPIAKAVDWVLGKAKGLVSKVGGGLKKLGVKVKGALGIKEKTPQERLDKGMRAGVVAVNAFKKVPVVGEQALRGALGGVRAFYKLSVLEPFSKDQRWHIRGDVQRATEIKTDLKAGEAEIILPVKDGDTISIINQQISGEGRKDGSTARGRPKLTPGSVKIDQTKKLVEWRPKQGSGARMWSFAKFIEKENKLDDGGWQKGDVREIHDEFKPKNIVTRTDGSGEKTILYDYSGANFEVQVGLDDIPKKVVATSLQLKHEVGLAGKRGVVEDPTSGFARGIGFDRAHAIADRFLGSGYRESFNIVGTSATYNQIKMKQVENGIARFIGDKAENFDMAVEMQWGDFNSPDVRKTILARLRTAVKSTYADLNDAELDATLQAFLANAASRGATNVKRCLGMTYTVTVRDIGGPPTGRTLIKQLGPDTHAGVD